MKTFVLLCVLVFTNVCAQAQTGFLTKINDGWSLLTENQKGKVSRLVGSKAYKSIEYVKIGRISDHQKKGVLFVGIPGKLDVAKYVASSVEASSEDNYKWYGNSDNGGSAILIAEGGSVYGHISTYSGSYKIIGLDKGISILAEIEPVDGKTDCLVKSRVGVEKPATSPTNARARQSACNSPIRVLFLSTQAARMLDGNIEQTINTCIGQFGNALNNSQLYNSGAFLVSAGYIPITFTETGDVEADVTAIATRADIVSARNANTDSILMCRMFAL
jgi:hypothetical protein